MPVKIEVSDPEPYEYPTGKTTTAVKGTIQTVDAVGTEREYTFTYFDSTGVIASADVDWEYGDDIEALHTPSRTVMSQVKDRLRDMGYRPLTDR